MTTTKATKQALITQLARYKADTDSSLRHLSDEIGYPVATIQSWLSKKYLPTEENLDNIKIFLASKNYTAPTARMSEETAHNLIKELRTFKKQNDLTYVELGEKIGISEQVISNWFKGLSAPTALNAYHIRNFFASGNKQTTLFESIFETQLKQSDMSMTAPDGTKYISSRSVAEWTEKRHDNLVRDIENYIRVLSEDEQTSNLRNGLTSRVESYFIADTYQAEDGGRAYKMYWCSRKGCEMIANKMTGARGIRFTSQYIEVFHSMEQALNETPTQQPAPEPEPTPRIDESPELAYIRSKLTEIMAESDLQAIYKDLNQLQTFVTMVKPRQATPKEELPPSNLGVRK
ncbi:Rha family transcriptional regulator [Streptococcus suis]|uniref:Rha family transcriptional regulator n=1 Tax=Streptococcus suis TaxID=1307 RepID=UPI002117FE87|nr:Rha family transcriptional regulator [Streptococcus suis]MCQ8264133.1 Rha family transcriptional regulator [Streptococcus suis]